MRAVIDPAVWTGADLQSCDDWILRLSDEHVAALGKVAAQIVPHLDGDPSTLLSLPDSMFDLGVAAPLIDDLRSRLGDGLGFVLVRGLPIEEWSKLAIATVYWVIGSRLGRPLANNPAGDMLGHVTDLGKDLDHPLHRAYQTNVNMYFHIDQCDVVGLLCLRQAKSGGMSKIASSLHVHNMMVEREPELAAALREPLRWSRMGEVGPGQDAWYPAPVFASTEGRLSVSAGIKHIEKGHELPGAPALPAVTRHALEVLNDLCEEFHLSMEFEPGDMQFLNNAVCMHSRTGYEDWPETDRRRLLWRLWLNVPDLRPRSPFFENWRDGIWAPDERRNISLDSSL